MINIINTFKDKEYIGKYKHDEFENANTKLQPEDGVLNENSFVPVKLM